MGVLSSRMRNSFEMVLLMLAAGIWAAPTMAAEGETESGDAVEADADDPVRQARENFTQGQAAYEAGDFEKADMHFSMAYKLKPHPSALKMVAECKLQLGQLPEAVTILEQLLADSSYEKKKQLKRRLKKVKKKVGQLHIESNPAGAVISLNGKILEEKTPTSVYVNPGTQNVVLLMENYEEQASEVDVAARKEATVSVDYSTLTPLPVPKPELIDDPFGEEEEESASAAAEEPPVEEAVEPEPTEVEDEAAPVAVVETDSGAPPKAFWAAAAIAGVGLVSGTVFGTMALRDEKDFEESGDSATRDSGRRSAVIADISFGVAIVAAVAGTIILIRNKNKKEATGESSEAARFYVHPSAGAQAVGLTSGFSF